MYTIIERLRPVGVEPATFKLGLPTIRSWQYVYKAELVQVYASLNDTGPPETAVCYTWQTRLSKTKKCYSIPVYYALKKFS